MAASLSGAGAVAAAGSASADLRRFFFAGFFVTSPPRGAYQLRFTQELHHHAHPMANPSGDPCLNTALMCRW